MDLRDLIPRSGIPRTYHPAGQEVTWAFDVERDRFDKAGGHPLYGEGDVTYRFNSRGYRCADFDTVADIRILAIGCSYVFGLGVPQAATFPELFAEKLRASVAPKTVVVWNLGLCGASNDYINRMLYFAVPWLEPHITLINFTHFSRREYITVQDRYINYLPQYTPSDDVFVDVFRHFDALTSPPDDQLNFFRNYKAVESLLAERRWIYSYPGSQDVGPVAGHLDQSRFAGVLQTIDRARDHLHPGPESHRRMAELYWSRYLQLSGEGDPSKRAGVMG